jgi:23S rRNA pseudouridine1911/1915/1917 synthase
MSKYQSNIQLSLLKEEKVSNFLKDVFHSSNNKLKKYFKHNFLDKIIYQHKTLELPIDFTNDGLISPYYDGPAIEILFEDDHFLVLDKPANIFVHPLKYSEFNNCLSYLRSINKKVLNVNAPNYDRGLLYRLDFETSGVLIYVKKDNLYTELRHNFDSIAKEKIYLAQVNGQFPNVIKLENILRPYGVGGSKMKALSVIDKKTTEEISTLEILENNFDQTSNNTLLKIKLNTGHRHQIRAQLEGMGFPIIGDKLYGGKNSDRLYLHALNYQIKTGDKFYSFESKPIDFI